MQWVQDMVDDPDCDFNSNSDPLKVELRQRYLHACENILCSSKSTVEGASKPLIEGPLSMGCFKIADFYIVKPPKSRGKYRDNTENSVDDHDDDSDDDNQETVPEQESTELSDSPIVAVDCADDTFQHGINLTEAIAFCDKVGFPVMVKGVQGGHATCGAWGAVAGALSGYPAKSSSTREYHCYIQKHVIGTEKTIIFAAVDGE